MTATLVEVSTRPGMSALIFITPCGRAEMVAQQLLSARGFPITLPFFAPFFSGDQDLEVRVHRGDLGLRQSC